MAIVRMKKVTVHNKDSQTLDQLKQLKDYHYYSDELGFITAKEVSLLSTVSNLSYEVTDPEIEDDIQPPVILHNHFWNKPFEEFVVKHGLPNYFNLDPTFYLALCFEILFGIMFGDVGQGIVLILIGLLFMRKKPQAVIFTRVGFFSILGGFLYGSFFGNEEIIPEVMEKLNLFYWRFELLARNNTENLLLFVMGLGSLMILIAILMNIWDLLKDKRKRVAIYDTNGLAGLCLYGSIMALTYGAIFNKGLSPLAWICGLSVLLLGIILFLLEPKQLTHRSGIKSSFRHLWSALIGFASSSMAFLMVGCFALAHGALMYVVWYLASLVPSLSILIIILGNGFVMGLEATEVWHQCLNLEFKILQPRLKASND